MCKKSCQPSAFRYWLLSLRCSATLSSALFGFTPTSFKYSLPLFSNLIALWLLPSRRVMWPRYSQFTDTAWQVHNRPFDQNRVSYGFLNSYYVPVKIRVFHLACTFPRHARFLTPCIPKQIH